MSFLRKMFGMESIEELKAKGERAFAEGDFGTAKLSFERALEKAPDAMRTELATGVEKSRNAIAEERLVEAERLIAQGSLDLAESELLGAIEVAASPEVAHRARDALDQMDQKGATEAAEDVHEVTDEERLALIAGNWEEPQSAEYESYGPPLENAILALHDDRAEEAREILEALISETEEPRYLYLELARARLLTDDADAGEEALKKFLETLTEGEGGEARLAAHLELARLLDERDDEDGAIAQYEAAIEELEEDPRPYLWLGRYLRSKGHAEEAVEVIEAALAVMDSAQPDWRVMQELGLAQAAAGRDDHAIESLEQVLTTLAARRHLDFPPETAVALAKLHEKQGRLERAADLYRGLTEGSDRDNFRTYAMEAGRILEAMEQPLEARRMLQRARALAGDDPTLAEELDRRIESLGD